MNRRLGLLFLAGVSAAAVAAGATGAPERASGALEINATLITSRTSSGSFCPPGTGANSDCFRYVGDGSIRGLGAVTSRYTKIITIGDAACEVRLLLPVVLEVPRKGTLELSRPGTTCWPFSLPVTIGPLDFTVSGGSGKYAGATGSVTFTTHVSDKPQGERGASTDIWSGTLAVPGVEFDLTPPTISGAVSKTVRAPRAAKRLRVRYSVTAQDAVDGSVQADCVPRSGSFFWLGRTRVVCTATDSSANASEARFTVTVKRRTGRSS
jgi:HYR domain